MFFIRDITPPLSLSSPSIPFLQMLILYKLKSKYSLWRRRRIKSWLANQSQRTVLNVGILKARNAIWPRALSILGPACFMALINDLTMIKFTNNTKLGHRVAPDKDVATSQHVWITYAHVLTPRAWNLMSRNGKLCILARTMAGLITLQVRASAHHSSAIQALRRSCQVCQQSKPSLVNSCRYSTSETGTH